MLGDAGRLGAGELGRALRYLVARDKVRARTVASSSRPTLPTRLHSERAKQVLTGAEGAPRQAAHLDGFVGKQAADLDTATKLEARLWRALIR